MNMRSPVYTELTECQDCYKCVRRCPVKAIQVEHSHARVIPDRCVFCGKCVISCPAHAKRCRNDVGAAKHLLETGGKVVVSLAPSFIAEFAEWTPETLIAALKKLGFDAVSETALGADFLSARIAGDLRAAAEPGASGQRLFISSACPTAVEYIKRYMPRFASCVMPHASPLLTHARFLRAEYGSDTGVVFIGPCFSKKREADIWNEISAAITFQELREWLQKEHISPQNVKAGEDCRFVPRRSAGGTFFPLDGGEIQAWSAYGNIPVASTAVSGMSAIEKALNNFSPETLMEPLFLEVLACSGGCVNGPGTTGAVSGLARRLCVSSYAQAADDTLDGPMLEKSPPVEADFPASPTEESAHTEAEIAAALRAVGKFTVHDRLNCSACGYDSCRDFAVALLENRAEKSQCASYMRNLATKKANGLIQAIPSGVVIADKNLSIVECNRQFAKLMGSETEDIWEVLPGLEGADLRKITSLASYFEAALALDTETHTEADVRAGRTIFHINVFVIEKGEIVAGVIEDITQPRNRIDKTVSRARQIIEQNVTTVQKIAFLLGENAAETEAILNSIIESYTVQDEESSDA
jgi:iron only hydrogenase large subunit-like protein